MKKLACLLLSKLLMVPLNEMELAELIENISNMLTMRQTGASPFEFR